jgi:hypothetical protein
LIPFASQRGGGQDLATHLLNEYDNEIAALDQLRGAVASDLHGALKEWEVLARTLTRCEKYLYSLSINPDPRQKPLTREQYMDYIGRTEEALGLSGQPRAIVFHTKYGREHCHVVWSRIDAQEKKAVHLAFDHEKLMRVTRSFARDHDLKLPPGYEKSRGAGQETLYEREQQRQTGLSKADHMRHVTQAWQHSDDARSFVQALSEKGYILATGKRPYILVDIYGGMNALSKLIDDKEVRTADIRKFLERDFPAASLPTVEEAQALVARHRALLERELKADARADGLAQLQHSQRERRTDITRTIRLLINRQQAQREVLHGEHRAQRSVLRHGHLEAVHATRQTRYENRPTGLAAFLGRVTGIEHIRKVLHRRDDAKRLTRYREQRKALQTEQRWKEQALERRLKLQMQELTRREAAFEKLDRRELAAFLRDQRRTFRVQQRGNSDEMPSLEHVARIETRAPRPVLDVIDMFERAVTRSPSEHPNLLSAFRRAARRGEETERETRDTEQRVHGEELRPLVPPDHDGPQKPRDRG